jgi:hypothetical protein
MLSKLGIKTLLWLLSTGFLLFLNLSCESRDAFVGSYSGLGEGPQQYAQAEIKLKEDGYGLWRVADEEVSFRWDCRGNEIRLHTKEGGVIIGEIKGGNLKITLPGTKSMSFKKRGVP